MRLGARAIIGLGRRTAPPPGGGGDSVYVYAGRADGLDARYLSENVEKFDLAARTVSVATAINHTVMAQGYAGCGDTVAARLHGSVSCVAASLKYTYATEVTTAGASMSTLQHQKACQSATKGYFFGGENLSLVISTLTEKITFATETRAVGTALGSPRLWHAAAGNDTRAIVACGINNALTQLQSTEKYTYATDARAAATSLSQSKDSIAACMCQTFGVFTGGVDSMFGDANTEKYTFGTDSRANTTTLTDNTSASGGGNNMLGLSTGGDVTVAPETGQTIKSYLFASDTVTTETNLNHTRSFHAVTCTAPGGL